MSFSLFRPSYSEKTKAKDRREPDFGHYNSATPSALGVLSSRALSSWAILDNAHVEKEKSRQERSFSAIYEARKV